MSTAFGFILPNVVAFIKLSVSGVAAQVSMTKSLSWSSSSNVHCSAPICFASSGRSDRFENISRFGRNGTIRLATYE